MARDELSAWRRVVLSIGYTVASLVLFAIAFGLVQGVVLAPNVQRYGQPKPWTITPLDAPLTQAIGALSVAIGGIYLLCLAVKTLKGSRK